MTPRQWYACGIRLLGRTAVKCTRDALGDRIGRDVASVAEKMDSNQLVIFDPFAGSCNTLFWIVRHLRNSEGIGFESDPQVYELTHRNLTGLGQSPGELMTYDRSAESVLLGLGRPNVPALDAARSVLYLPEYVWSGTLNVSKGEPLSIMQDFCAILFLFFPMIGELH
jgi:hypothetical protein